MATHSGIFAWKIPWTEEPGGLQPWGHKKSDTTEATEHEHVGDSDNEKLTTLLLWLVFGLCPSAIDGNEKLESTQIIGLSSASSQNDRALRSHQE